jgi:hypothetical protein
MNERLPTRLPTTETNPRVHQNKTGNFLNEYISLYNDDPRDLNDTDINGQHFELLPLDNYEI